MVLHGIDLDSLELRRFCQRWKITEMEVFGSVLRDDFREDSDVDFLVTFDEGVRWRFREVCDMEEELARIVGRNVDVIERSDLDDPDANPYRRAHIMANKRRIHVAG